MRIEDHIAVVSAEGELLSHGLAGADPDSVVPMCPEWTVQELARQTGRCAGGR